MTSWNRPARAASRLTVLAAAVAFAILVAACGPGTTASPSAPSASAPPSSPPASAPPSGSPATSVTTPEAAAALVLATDARFTGLTPKNPDMIGACCFYEVTSTGDGYSVKIEIGWGDCQAGCIERHHWTYTVTKSGQVTFVGEDGPVVPPGVPATGGAGSGDGGNGVAGIRGTALAGPTCPVVTVNDPNCADRPVAGATVHVLDATGVEVAQLTTDAAGSFMVALPAGRYTVTADAVEGLMSGPSPSEVVVAASMAVVDLAYETGIR